MDYKIDHPDIQYADLFWLFILGSLLGVILEGLFCLVKYGHWETHGLDACGSYLTGNQAIHAMRSLLLSNGNI